MSDERKDNALAQVPYFVHEGDMERLERANKRQFVIILVLIIALICSNVGWIYYESQFEDEVTTITQDNKDGINNYIGNDGDIYNGETDNND